MSGKTRVELEERSMQNRFAKGRIPSRRFTRIGLMIGVPLAIIGGAQAAGFAAAAIKTWVDGETLTAADLNANFAALQTAITGVFSTMPGGSAQTAGASCAALRTAGITQSGQYWVNNPASADAAQVAKPVLVYCDQVTNGGGWTLVYNSVLGTNTLDFWYIPYAARLGRRGRPALDSSFYDGSIYQTAASTYMDVVEDFRGGNAVAFVATSDGINNTTMRFANPVRTSGDDALYQGEFANGWSAPDYDGDTYATSNCSTDYSGVTQHYSQCWAYNLGSDADTSGGDNTDTRVGPHMHKDRVAALGLAGDGSDYSRVRRISRFVKW
jgi:hypothetical protein